MQASNLSFLARQLLRTELSGRPEEIAGGSLFWGEELWAGVWQPEALGDAERFILDTQRAAAAAGRPWAGVVAVTPPQLAGEPAVAALEEALYVYGFPRAQGLEHGGPDSAMFAAAPVGAAVANEERWATARRSTPQHLHGAADRAVAQARRWLDDCRLSRPRWTGPAAAAPLARGRRSCCGFRKRHAGVVGAAGPRGQRCRPGGPCTSCWATAMGGCATTCALATPTTSVLRFWRSSGAIVGLAARGGR
jgi:hypothetical protein